MCPCTVLGAAWKTCRLRSRRRSRASSKCALDKLTAEGLSASSATETSTITGALVVANALGDTGAYDRATSDLLRLREAAQA